MFSEMESTQCGLCGGIHLDFWTEIFLKVIRCERFQKTAEYVSELLEPHGKTLSYNPEQTVDDGFGVYTTGGKPPVLRIVRWWSHHYFWAQEHGVDVCLRDLVSNCIPYGNALLWY